jgi:uncharacterized protein
MEILALFILALFCLIGFIAVFFNAFGTFIILAGAIAYAYLTEFSIITVNTLIILSILFIVGELLDYVFLIFGAKKFGASNKAVIAGMVGGILGAMMGIALLGIGALIGGFIGIFAGAFLMEYRLHQNVKKSFKVGAGSLLGVLGAIGVKFFLAVAMVVILAVPIFKHGIDLAAG